MQQHMQQAALMAICFIIASLGAIQTSCQYEDKLALTRWIQA